MTQMLIKTPSPGARSASSFMHIDAKVVDPRTREIGRQARALIASALGLGGDVRWWPPSFARRGWSAVRDGNH